MKRMLKQSVFLQITPNQVSQLLEFYTTYYIATPTVRTDSHSTLDENVFTIVKLKCINRCPEPFDHWRAGNR